MKHRRILAAIVILVAALGGLTIKLVRGAGEASIGYTDLIALASRGEVRAAHVHGEEVVVETPEGRRAAVIGDEAARHALVDRLAGASVPVDFEAREPGPGSHTLAALAPLAVVALGAAFVMHERKKGRAH